MNRTGRKRNIANHLVCKVPGRVGVLQREVDAVDAEARRVAAVLKERCDAFLAEHGVDTSDAVIWDKGLLDWAWGNDGRGVWAKAMNGEPIKTL